MMAIAAGTQCNVSPVSPAAEVSEVTLAKGSTNTVLLSGGSGVPATLTVLPEDQGAPPDPSQQRVRFVNALGGPPSVLFGMATSPALPTQLGAVFSAEPVPFGRAAPAGSTVLGDIDANGYLNGSGIAPPIYGVALPEQSNADALLVSQVPRATTNFTLFAAGDLQDTTYPAQGILCNDFGAVDASGVLNGSCTESNPPNVVIDAFNTALYGAYAPVWQEREPYIIRQIAALSDDIVCLAEISDPVAQQAMIDGTKKAFPYAAVANTTLTTPVTDPSDQHGAIPPPPTPPCTSADQEQAAVDCLVQNCGDATGALRPDGQQNCISAQCAGPFVSMLGSAPRCYECIIAEALSFEKFTTLQNDCATNPNAGYAYNGRTPSMVLSKFPLKNVGVYVLPSSMFRRSFITAQVDLGDSSFDLYCGQLSFIQGTFTPYAGNYGEGATDTAGWASEQTLQAQKLVAFVKKNSGARPAVITGDFASSSQFPKDPSTAPAAVVVNALNPSAVGQLQSAFVEAIASDYTPKCMVCPPPANIFNDPSTHYWSNRVFTYNFPTNAATGSRQILNLSSVVPVSKPYVAQGGTYNTVPLSDGFGYSVRLLRPSVTK
jgi:hypothetical protein